MSEPEYIRSISHQTAVRDIVEAYWLGYQRPNGARQRRLAVDMQRAQLDLIALHRPRMDAASAARADRTIRCLRADIDRPGNPLPWDAPSKQRRARA